MQIQLELPEFPKTHFWKKTNKNPKMIEERKLILEQYFNVVINDPFSRGYKDVKKFIRVCKLANRPVRCFSQRKTTDLATSSSSSRARSLPKRGE